MASLPQARAADRPRVVIVGGGFAGVAAAQALRHSPVEVLLLDRRNHQIFQPLLYQVATAVLGAGDIAAPIRQLTATQDNLTVEMAEVTAIEAETRTVLATPASGKPMRVTCDYLILATGVRPSYFGHDEFAVHAPALKTLSDAAAIRSKILKAYELAELSEDDAERQRLLTFILVGGGPTGVELAATLAQMAQTTLVRDYRHFRTDTAQVLLIEAGARILPTFDVKLAAAAERRLGRLGVSVRTGKAVELVDEAGVVVGGQRIPAATVLWTAGVAASALAGQTGAETDRAGRAKVAPTLETADGSRIFVVGDTASLLQDGKPVPGVAQAAIQQGAHAGRLIAARVAGRTADTPFRYHDRGSMAVVGKDFAILESPTVKMSGRLTWLLWALIHITYLPRIQNRLRVNVQWLWTYFTNQRSSRLIDEILSTPL
jgi:NADH dehydrogenase